MYAQHAKLTNIVRASLKLSDQTQQSAGAHYIWRQLLQLHGAAVATVAGSVPDPCATTPSNSFSHFATASDIGHSHKRNPTTYCSPSVCSLPPTVRPVSLAAAAALLPSTSVIASLSASRRREYSKFTAAREPPHALGTIPLNEDRAIDLVSSLKDSERAAIKTALEKYDAVKLKEGFEGKLADTRWRTRFGPTKRPALGEVDPTGSFCPFPDDWLKKKMAENAAQPLSSDLRKIFIVNAVPFVAFGFLDNFVMIVAGDYIEYGLGSVMCLSTMAAAGLGNTVSDVLGIGSAYYVERGCDVIGLRPPELTPIQMEMKSSRRAGNYGRIIGIIVGCLLGMFPLFFIKTKKNVGEETIEKTGDKTA